MKLYLVLKSRKPIIQLLPDNGFPRFQYQVLKSRKPIIQLLPDREMPNPENAAKKWVSNRTRKSYMKLSNIDNVQKFLISRTLTKAVKSHDMLVDDLDNKRMLGEVIGILRPVIYGNYIVIIQSIC